ncbi:MAG: glycosyltransferase [Thermosediminibacteraceae bacterium]|nr:glycosyltransferase [Thermosediminibacteraceae bacterium]
MKVALIAFSVRGAMGHYLEALENSLSKYIDLHLFVPSHYQGQVNNSIIHYFETGQSKYEALLRFLNPSSALDIWQRVERIRPQIIHLFNGEGYPWALLLAYLAKRIHIPFLVTIHDPEPHPGDLWGKLNAIFRRITFRYASGFHIHNPKFIETLERQGISRENIQVIPHGNFANRFLKFIKPGIKREMLALFLGVWRLIKGWMFW